MTCLGKGGNKSRSVITLVKFCSTVSLQTYQGKNEKRDYAKMNYCLYCEGKYISKISKHLMAVHRNEDGVKAAMGLPVGSKARKMAFSKLQNEGNFQHNCKVCGFRYIHEGKCSSVLGYCRNWAVPGGKSFEGWAIGCGGQTAAEASHTCSLSQVLQSGEGP